MDGGERWRVITRTQDKTIMNRIMLRFRPIAPKPVTDGSSSTGGLVSSIRSKRKYVKVKKSNDYHNRRRNKNKAAPDLEDDAKTKEKIYTLQLLPEKTVDLVKDRSGSCNNGAAVEEETAPIDLSRQGSVGVTEGTFIETVVTVESAMDTCVEEMVGGECTEMERLRNLEKDTCPGFVSDGESRVQWVNEAYRKMVMGRAGQWSSVEVRLEMKEKVLPYLNHAAFTSWVRLQYTWQKEKCTQIVPCDVWKTSFGGFAWRLDVKAALSLSLQN